MKSGVNFQVVLKRNSTQRNHVKQHLPIHCTALTTTKNKHVF